MTDYFVEGGDTLENKLHISDPKQLREAEENAFSDAVADILDQDFSNTEFGFEFLKYLHGLLFGAIYPFAGQARTVNITKADSDIPFCMADYITTEAARIFSDLKSKNYLQDTPEEQFANSIAELATELNALHPFREGNGRTIRLYLQLLASKANYLISYDLVGHEEIIEADKRAFIGDDSLIREMYHKIISPIS